MKISLSSDLNKKVSESGTYYHIETPDKLIELLEKLRAEQVRVALHYGDTKTGQSWHDTHHISGYLGRSMGPIKVPVLLYNRRSLGGPEILTNCIIKIVATRGGKVLHQVHNSKAS